MSSECQDAKEASGVGCIALVFAVCAFILAMLQDQLPVRRIEAIERDVTEIKKALNIPAELGKEETK